MAIIAPLAGWLLPGLGHFIQRRWIRGVLLMASVFVMFFVGLGMQGKVYSFNTGDLLDILGFIGDLGSGALYFAARAMDWGIGDIHRAVADYGTKYIVVARTAEHHRRGRRSPHRDCRRRNHDLRTFSL